MRFNIGKYTVYFSGSFFADIFLRRVGWQRMVADSFGYRSCAKDGGTGRAIHCGPLGIYWAANRRRNNAAV